MAVPDARNSVMRLMVLLQNVDAFNARSGSRQAFRIPFSSNRLLVFGVAGALLSHVAVMHVPLVQKVLDTGPVSGATWLALGATAISLLAVMELQKISWRWRRRRPKRQP